MWVKIGSNSAILHDSINILRQSITDRGKYVIATVLNIFCRLQECTENDIRCCSICQIVKTD